MRLRRPSVTTVLASLALFFALGGSAIAAQHYLITSIDQIKPSVLDKLKGKPGIQGAAGPSGQNGAPGATGPTGPAGPAGPQGTVGVRGPEGQMGPRGPEGSSGGGGGGALSDLILEEGPENRVPAYNELGPEGEEGVEASVATCPSGDHVVSGGSDVFAGIVEGVISVPSKDHRSWIVVVANDSTYTQGVVQALAYCASAGEGVAAKAPGAAHSYALKEAGKLRVKLAARLKASRG